MRRALFVPPFLALVILACGTSGAPAGSDVDGGREGGTAPPACASSVRDGDPCSTGGACCTVNVPDGFGPEGFRCNGSAWKADSSCLPPPPACPSPLTGTLTRADASTVKATCFQKIGFNKVIGATLQLDSGESMEIFFERVPKTGEVLPVAAYDTIRPLAVTTADAGDGDAGAPRAGMHVGVPGGFSGFAESSKSLSGTMTITSITADSMGVISALSASVDAQMSGPSAAWAGKLSGSW